MNEERPVFVKYLINDFLVKVLTEGFWGHVKGEHSQTVVWS